MISPLVAIARNTFIEVIRQPAFGIVVIVTLIMYALSPFFALFSLGEEASMLKDFGTSTLLLSGWVLTCLGASHVVRREIELRTTLTLLSKPVSREVFLVAKFLGVVAAVALATYIFALALLLAVRQGPVGSRHDEVIDWPVLVGGLGALLLTLLGAGLRNFLARRSFSSSTVMLGALFLSLGFLVASLFDPGWSLQVFGGGFDDLVARAALLAFLVLAILAAFAVSVSVWFGRGGALALTALLFIAGLYVASRPGAWNPGRFFLPDFRFFWAGEVFYRQGGALPSGYVATCALYALCYVVVFLALGSWSFRRKGL